MPLLPSREGVPDAVLDIAKRLSAELVAEGNPGDGLAILSRLLNDDRMLQVWQTLYSKKRQDYKPTTDFEHPAVVSLQTAAKRRREHAKKLRETGKKDNEIEAALHEAVAAAEEALPRFAHPSTLNEQDLGVQYFFEYACRCAINIQPMTRKDVECYIEELSRQIADLRDKRDALDGREEVSQKLTEYITTLEEDKFEALDVLKNDDLVLNRDRGNSEVRTYIINLARLTRSIFESPLYGTLATVAEVVFCSKVTRDMVRDWVG